jgi:hypothetical protein
MTKLNQGSELEVVAQRSQTNVNDSILDLNENQVITPEKIFQISNAEKKGEFECF